MRRFLVAFPATWVANRTHLLIYNFNCLINTMPFKRGLADVPKVRGSGEIPRQYQAKLDEMREEMIVELTAFVSQQVSQQSSAGTSGAGAGISGPNTNAP